MQESTMLTRRTDAAFQHISNPQPSHLIRSKTIPASLIAIVPFTCALVGIRDLFYGNVSNVVFSLTLWAIGIIFSFLAGRSLERREQIFLIRTFALSFALRVSVAVVLWMLVLSMTGVAFHPGGDDADFDRHGRWISEAWQRGDWGYRVSWLYENGYNYVVASVYFLASYFNSTDQLGVILVNCLFGALLVLPGYRIARMLYNESIARRASMLLAFAPDLFLYSLIELRDILVALLVIAFIWCIINYLFSDRGRRIGTIVVGAIIGMYALPSLRPELLPVAFLTLAANLAAVAMSGHALKIHRSVRLLAILGLLFVIPASFYLQRDPFIAIMAEPLEPAERYIAYYQRVAASSSLGIRTFTLPLSLRVPVNLANLLMLPFPPWAGLQPDRTWFSVLQTTDAPFWYVVAPYWLIGIIWSFRKNKFLHFPVYGTCLFWILAISLGAAIDLRLRTMAMPLMLIVAAVGWEHRHEYRVIPRLWWVTIIITVLAYVLIKGAL